MLLSWNLEQMLSYHKIKMNAIALNSVAILWTTKLFAIKIIISQASGVYSTYTYPPFLGQFEDDFKCISLKGKKEPKIQLLWTIL